MIRINFLTREKDYLSRYATWLFLYKNFCASPSRFSYYFIWFHRLLPLRFHWFCLFIFAFCVALRRPVLFGIAKMRSFLFLCKFIWRFFFFVFIASLLVFNILQALRLPFLTRPFRDCKGENLFLISQEVFLFFFLLDFLPFSMLQSALRLPASPFWDCKSETFFNTLQIFF